ncbi:MAG: LysM peptidoglycan-binding domain-containing protein, partial [Gammaproteobacteria bacterium]|nr:LysM peptidoglycan-binding domain-containing protein [Gammaproteobacteria bacterium]
MNTPNIFIKYLRLIVTCLLVIGVSACSFPAKRKPSQSQAGTTQTIEQQDAGDTSTDASQAPEKQQESTTAQTDSSDQKRSTIHIKKSHPRRYTVKKGDTLWDISSQFLRDPWFWPEIWHKNRQVENPHLIYPGDILTLIYVNGQPQIVVDETAKQKTTHTTSTIENNGQPLRTVKLSPSIHKHGLDTSVVTIPGDAIRQFLTKPRVVTKAELEKAPYILASDDNHLIMGQDNTIYIRGELDKERVRFTVFRPGEALIN